MEWGLWMSQSFIKQHVIYATIPRIFNMMQHTSQIRSALLICVSSFMCACSTSETIRKQETNLYYEKDIKFSINGTKYTGSAVVELMDKYKITVYPEGKADFISLTSCHREIRTQDPDKKMFEKGYTFEVSPSELEANLSCPLELAVLEKNKGRNAWGAIVIKTQRASMQAEILCNGEKTISKGVSYCQSRKGLIQEYKFNREVIVVTIPECGIGVEEGSDFKFLLPRGACTVYFLDKSDKQTIHQANFYGYDDILLRD